MVYSLVQRKVIYKPGSAFDTYWREFDDGSWSCCLFVGARSVAYVGCESSQESAYRACVELLGVSEREGR